MRVSDAMSSTLTSMQLHEAHQLLTTAGWKQTALAKHYGVSAPTLCRLLARFKQTGDAEAAVKKHYATGPREDEHTLTTDEIYALKHAMLKKRSRRLAADELMSHTACTAATFERLAAIFDRAAESGGDESWPKWFQRACVLTAEEELLFRGSKAFARVAPARARGNFYELADGTRHPLFANAVWEFDDESENTPWVELDDDGKARVNRQTLKAIDVYSAFYLGLRAISRNSDGYRVEDQADFLLELIDAHGMPLRCRIERGPWDNNFWFGIPQKREWYQTPECASFRFGGIDTSAGGPIGVIQCFESRHKGLMEGSFNHRQNIGAHKTTDIGRFRGEHEQNAKRLTAAQNLKDAERLERAIAHFPQAGPAADIGLENLDQFNAMAKRRRFMFGARKVVPAELYATAVKRELPASERWRFLPVKVTTTVRNAHVVIKAKEHDIPFQFTAEGFTPQWDWQAWLPHGWRVFACFHPHRPDLGCHIFNALHPEHAQNPCRFPLGMPLGVLPFAPLAPNFSDAPRDFSERKKTQAAYRAETRITRASQSGVRVSTVVAAGQVRTVRKGSRDPLHKLPPVLASMADLDHGAPPVGDAAPFLERGGDSRSAQTEHAERTADDRGHPIGQAARVSGHGTTRHAQGSSTSAARLAELEAALE